MGSHRPHMTLRPLTPAVLATATIDCGATDGEHLADHSLSLSTGNVAKTDGDRDADGGVDGKVCIYVCAPI